MNLTRVPLLLLFFQAQPPQGETPGRFLSVRLDMEGAPLADVFAEVGRQTGESLEVDPVIAADPVTIRLDDIPFFQALDDICRTHERSRPIFQTFTRTILIRSAPYAPYPQAIGGPFLFRIQSMRLVRESRYEGPSVHTLLIDLAVAWAGDDSLAALCGPPRLTVARDDTGKSLLRDSPPSEAESDRILGKPEIVRRMNVLLDAPDSKARSVARLEGIQTVARVVEWSDIRIPAPRSGAATDTETGASSIKSWERKETTVTVSVEFIPRSPLPEEEVRLLGSVDRLGSARLVDRSGKLYAGRIASGFGSADRAGWELHWKDIPGTAELAELHLTFASRVEAKDIPFTFRDLILP